MTVQDLIAVILRQVPVPLAADTVDTLVGAPDQGVRGVVVTFMATLPCSNAPLPLAPIS